VTRRAGGVSPRKGYNASEEAQIIFARFTKRNRQEDYGQENCQPERKHKQERLMKKELTLAEKISPGWGGIK
jgi:hypothetical protein